MRLALLGSVLVVAACHSGPSVQGAAVPLGEPVTELRLERRAGVVPMNVFGAVLGGEVRGQLSLTLALGDGFALTTRLKQEAMYLVPCGFGSVRFGSVLVHGDSVSADLDSTTGEVLVTALREGDATLEVIGTFSTVVGHEASCAGETAGPRPLAAQLDVHVRNVVGYELVARCRAMQPEVVVGLGGRVPAVLAFPKDSSGSTFIATNAAYDAQVTMRVRAPQPMIAPLTADSSDWAFTAPGAVELVVDTALEVTGPTHVKVVAPDALTSLTIAAWVPPNGGHGTSFDVTTSPMQVTLTPTTLPLLVPKYVDARVGDVSLCQPPPASFYELQSLTPGVCTPSLVDVSSFAFSDGIGLAARFERDGRCQMRVGVAGQDELQVDFTVDVANVARAAPTGS